MSSRQLINKTAAAMLRGEQLKVETLASPSWVRGVDFSDHYSFWQEGYDALMITDTAFYRYAHYHSPHDTPDKLDYEFMTAVTDGLLAAIAELAVLK